MKTSNAVLCLALMLFLLPTVYGQTDKKLFSIGFNTGKMYPFGKSIIATEEEPNLGKPSNGINRDFYFSYHLTESSRILATFMVQRYNNLSMDSYLNGLLDDHSLDSYQTNTMKSFSLGLYKSIFLNGRKDYHFFVSPNIGIERSKTIFDNLTFRSDSIAPIISLPSYVNTKIGLPL